jgi:hypothetical protein
MSQSNPVEEVRAMQLMGTNVMVGIHSDGEQEVRLWNSEPTAPETAADMDPRTWGGEA